jgi:hypothetical protein
MCNGSIVVSHFGLATHRFAMSLNGTLEQYILHLKSSHVLPSSPLISHRLTISWFNHRISGFAKSPWNKAFSSQF